MSLSSCQLLQISCVRNWGPLCRYSSVWIDAVCLLPTVSSQAKYQKCFMKNISRLSCHQELSMIRPSVIVNRRKAKAFAGASAFAVALSLIAYPTPSDSFGGFSIHQPPSRNFFPTLSRISRANAKVIPFNNKPNLEASESILATSSITLPDPENVYICSTKSQELYAGKNILLTGASGGLGQAFAFQLARCGASKIILSGRDEKALEKVAEECREIARTSNAKTTVHIIKCDLSNADSVQNLGNEAFKCCLPGKVDVLINNGGISSRSSFLDTEIDVDELLMQVNFLSGAALAKIVAPGMLSSRKGKIIWISSVQGLVGVPNRTSYAASKFAVQGYCEALRAELASGGVTVHVASPGYIRTNLSRSAIQGNGTLYGKMDETTANGADPNEVAVEILDGVAEGKSDIVVAASISARVAIWLRFLAPSLLEKLLVKRFDSSQK